jgi:hypothetical protein
LVAVQSKIAYACDMMSKEEFAEHLSYLRLSLAEAAVLLGSSERSVRRWTEESVPGPVAAAVRAWRELESRRLPWKPDTISVLERDQDQLDRIRAHDEALAQVIREVEARGGPAEPWAVDLERGRATFSHAEVGFHRLANGGFNVSTYRRFDRTPSDADRLEIADAAYCIAQAFSRAAASAEALRALARYTREHGHLFVREGPAMLSPSDAEQRRQAIEKQADAIDTLAVEVEAGRASYAHFEEILRELHRLGFFPETSLVSAVARNMLAAPALRSPPP